MFWPVGTFHHINRDDFAMALQVKQVGVIKCTATTEGARFNDVVGFDFPNQLLVDPHVHRTLQNLMAVPIRVFPNARVVVAHVKHAGYIGHADVVFLIAKIGRDAHFLHKISFGNV